MDESPASYLKEERLRYQAALESGGQPLTLSRIAKELYPDFPRSDLFLRRIEGGLIRLPREEVRRILRFYHTPSRRIDQALAPYDVSEQLNELLLSSGLTRAALAERAGVSYAHTTRLLTGKRYVSSEEQLIKIATVMGAKSSAIHALLDTACISSVDSQWHGLLAEREGEKRSRRIACVHGLLEKLHRKAVGEQLPSSARMLKPGVDDLGTVARGPVEISSLATHVVGQADRAPLLSRRSPRRFIDVSLGKRFVGNKKALATFFACIQAMQEKGVAVRVLYPEPESVERLFQAIETALPFLGHKGGFELRYEKVDEDHAETALRMVASQSGLVLHLLPREPQVRDDHAVLVDAATAEVYSQHFERRFQQAGGLLRLYQPTSSGSKLAFQHALRRAEDEPGDRLIFRRRFDPTMIPAKHWGWERQQLEQATDPERAGKGSASLHRTGPWLFERLSISEANSATERSQLLASLHKEKVSRFRRLLEALNSGMEVREALPADVFRGFLMDAAMDEEVRLATVQVYLDLLAQYPNYSLALTRRPALPEALGVHGPFSVFVSLSYPGQGSYLHIHNRRAARAAREALLSTWRGLRPHEANKQAVSEYLRSLVEVHKLRKTRRGEERFL